MNVGSVRIEKDCRKLQKNEVKALFQKIAMWKRGSQRAPHKPLLLLYYLSQCYHNKGRLISYRILEKESKRLLVEFGPTRERCHPEYPFWRLQNDDIWELINTDKVTAHIGNTDAKNSELLKFNVHGGFNKNIYGFLKDNPSVMFEIALSLLEKNFPRSIHEDILTAVGLEMGPTEYSIRKRDPYFRDRILNAYEYKCAVCGFNVRVGDTLVALEAAHIKWHQAGGPDSEENGMALCALQHKLFDRGAFTISEDLRIHVSDRAHGTNGFKEWLMAFHGKVLNIPQRTTYYPKLKYVSWHVREVFQGARRCTQ